MNKGDLQLTIEWGVELGVEIAKDLEDNRMTLAETIGLWDNALRIGAVVKAIGGIPKEWKANKDSEEYMAAIIEGVSSVVKGIESDTSKKLVVQAIKTGIEAGKLIDLCVLANKERKEGKPLKA